MTLTPALDKVQFFFLCHPPEYFFIALFAFESVINDFNSGSVQSDLHISPSWCVPRKVNRIYLKRSMLKYQ